MATAIFKDLYFGPTKMTVEPFKTSHHGKKVIRYRWSPVEAGGCITTGLPSHGFSSIHAAIESARRHIRFAAVMTA